MGIKPTSREEGVEVGGGQPSGCVRFSRGALLKRAFLSRALLHIRVIGGRFVFRRDKKGNYLDSGLIG